MTMGTRWNPKSKNKIATDMTRDQAQKASQLLSEIQKHELAESLIRKLHKAASQGDQARLDELANMCLELNQKNIRALEFRLSLL